MVSKSVNLTKINKVKSPRTRALVISADKQSKTSPSRTSAVKRISPQKTKTVTRTSPSRTVNRISPQKTKTMTRTSPSRTVKRISPSEQMNKISIVSKNSKPKKVKPIAEQLREADPSSTVQICDENKCRRISIADAIKVVDKTELCVLDDIIKELRSI